MSCRSLDQTMRRWVSYTFARSMSGRAAICAKAASTSAPRTSDGAARNVCSGLSAWIRPCTNSLVSTASCHSRRWVMKRSSSAPIAIEMSPMTISASAANHRLRLKGTSLAV
jgi:hypothetical protein